jgi:hypothetical protein
MRLEAEPDTSIRTNVSGRCYQLVTYLDAIVFVVTLLPTPSIVMGIHYEYPAKSHTILNFSRWIPALIDRRLRYSGNDSRLVPGRNRLKLAGSLRIDEISSTSEMHIRRSPDNDIGILMFWRFIPFSNVIPGDRLAESRL